VVLLGFIDGMKGVANNNVMVIDEHTFKYFRNLGGYDYLGKAEDALRTHEHQAKALDVCNKFDLTGLILIGATHTLTDAAYLADYLLQNNSKTRVIAIPATVDGNIHHSYVATAVGFDTASKIYS
jgi:6-phosphofructokinase